MSVFNIHQIPVMLMHVGGSIDVHVLDSGPRQHGLGDREEGEAVPLAVIQHIQGSNHIILFIGLINKIKIIINIIVYRFRFFPLGHVIGDQIR